MSIHDLLLFENAISLRIATDAIMRTMTVVIIMILKIINEIKGKDNTMVLSGKF